MLDIDELFTWKPNSCHIMRTCKHAGTSRCGRTCMIYYKLNYIHSIDNMPRKYRDWNRMDLNSIDNKTKDLSFNHIEMIATDKVKTGLYLYGGVGAGKSALSCTLLNHFLRVTLNSYFEGRATDFADEQFTPILFVPFVDYCEMYKERFSTQDELYLMINKNLWRSDLIIFDDVGAEENTERNKTLLFRLLDDAQNNLRTYILTSNLTPEQFLSRYGERSYSRLENCCEMYQVLNKDLRR